MNPTIKTIVVWIVLLVTVVLLYNVFTHRPTGKETIVNFSRFMEDVNNKNVRNVKITGSELTGELISGGTFRTIVPDNYPALYDKLQGVEIQIQTPTQSPILKALVSWTPFLLIVFGVFVARVYFVRELRRNPASKQMPRNSFDARTDRGETNIVHLEPDVAKAFSNSQSVNEALRLVIQLSAIRGTVG